MALSTKSFSIMAFPLFSPAGGAARGCRILCCLMASFWSVSSHSVDVAVAAPKREVQALPYQEFNGKTIREVQIVVRDIFEGDDLGSFYRSVNALKISTREEVIRRELLLKAGATFDAFLLQESQRELRLLGFIRRAEIVPHPVPGSDLVDLRVSVQDTWTIIPQFGYSSGTGSQKITAGLAESNLMGFGKRLEALYEENDGNSGVELVWDDRRVWGTPAQFITGVFLREDGDRIATFLGDPYRTLPQKSSWTIDTDWFDGINRLYEAGDERYIFRRETVDLAAAYSFSDGDPETSLYRYTVGYGYRDNNFENATDQDFSDIDLDPSTVSRDPSELPDDRRFTGPLFGVKHVVPYLISRNYIDRFDRIEDYNLGLENSITAFVAPRLLGSEDDAIIVSAATLRGVELAGDSFARGELSGTTRMQDDGLGDSLIHLQGVYFYPYEPWFAGGWFLGRHTLAASLNLDYGIDLDRDREFSAGGDNSVRGYEARAFNGDKRYSLNFEDRVHLFENVLELASIGAAAFFDVGGATHESLGELITDRTYADFGVGLRLNFPRSSGARVLRLDVAFPLRDGPEDSRALEPRFLIAGGQLFGGRLKSETLGPDKSNFAVGIGP